MRARLLRPTVAALALASGLGAAAAFAADEPGNIIKYRQAYMRANGAHLTMIGAVAKGEVSWTDELVGHAHALHEQSKHLLRLFPEGSGKGDTDVESVALPAIWEQWGEFEQAAQKFEQESARLVEIAESGDIAALGPQLGELGCGGCHETFREKK